MGSISRIILKSALFVVVVVAGYIVIADYQGRHDDLADILSVTQLNASQTDMLIKRIGEVLVIPTDEKPAIVIIRDAKDLASRQPFYQGSKDGDVLIIYSDRIIIYDVREDKLVNVSPRVPETPEPTPPLESITLDILNGTLVAGRASQAAVSLTKEPYIRVNKTGDAKGNYTETLIVDLTKGTSGKSASIQALAAVLKGRVITALPQEERASSVDAIVIIGQ